MEKNKLSDLTQEMIAKNALWRPAQLTVTNDITIKDLYNGETVPPNNLQKDGLYKIEYHNAQTRCDVDVSVQNGEFIIFGDQVKVFGNEGFACDLPSIVLTNIDCIDKYDELKRNGAHLNMDKPNQITDYGERYQHIESFGGGIGFAEPDVDKMKKEEKSIKKDKMSQFLYVSKDAKQALANKYIDSNMTVACRSSDTIKGMFWGVDKNGIPQNIDLSKLEPGDTVLVGNPYEKFGVPDVIQDKIADIMVDEKHNVYLIELEGGLALSSIDFEKELELMMNEKQIGEDGQTQEQQSNEIER